MIKAGQTPRAGKLDFVALNPLFSLASDDIHQGR